MRCVQPPQLLDERFHVASRHAVHLVGSGGPVGCDDGDSPSHRVQELLGVALAPRRREHHRDPVQGLA